MCMKPAYAAMNTMARVFVFSILNSIFLFPISQFNFPAPVLINQFLPDSLSLIDKQRQEGKPIA